MKSLLRFLALSLALALLLPLAVGCGGGAPESDSPTRSESLSSSESDSESESGSESGSESVSETDPVSGITFASATVYWNGEEHSLAAENVPEGVTVSYEGNGRAEIGTYTVTATFAVPDGAAPISPMTATLTVKFDESRFITDG